MAVGVAKHSLVCGFTSPPVTCALGHHHFQLCLACGMSGYSSVHPESNLEQGGCCRVWFGPNCRWQDVLGEARGWRS